MSCDHIIGFAAGKYSGWQVTSENANQSERYMEEKYNFCPRCGKMLITHGGEPMFKYGDSRRVSVQ
jgi:hypothetical protein